MKLKWFILPIIIVLVILAAYLAVQQLTPFKINTNQTAVIKEIRSLNRLETAQFTIEKIIDAETNTPNTFQKILFGDQILLIAHGEVIAGLDLSKLQESDINVNNNELTINLPAPEVLVTRIDNEKTKVYDRRQGLLTKGNENLESEARKSAEDSIRQAACEADILKHAADNAKKQIKTMVSAYGYIKVSIEIPSASCK